MFKTKKLQFPKGTKWRLQITSLIKPAVQNPKHVIYCQKWKNEKRKAANVWLCLLEWLIESNDYQENWLPIFFLIVAAAHSFDSETGTWLWINIVVILQQRTGDASVHYDFYIFQDLKVHET